MNDASLMGVVEGIGHLGGDFPGVIEGQGAGRRDAIDEFHDQSAILDAIDLGDVGVVEGTKHLSFAGEAGEASGIGSEGVRKDLRATSRLILVSRAF